MRASLVAVFTAKLANLRDIGRCVPLAGDSRRARARLRGCLEATKQTSEAATNARARFLGIYNELRDDAGLESTNPVF